MADKGRCPHFKAALIEGTAGILVSILSLIMSLHQETNT